MKLIIVIEQATIEGRVMRIEQKVDLNRLKRLVDPPEVLWREIEELEKILVGKRNPSKP